MLLRLSAPLTLSSGRGKKGKFDDWQVLDDFKENGEDLLPRKLLDRPGCLRWPYWRAGKSDSYGIADMDKKRSQGDMVIVKCGIGF